MEQTTAENWQECIPGSLRLVEIEGKGRGLVASEPLKGGQIVLQESPILTFSAFPLKHGKNDEEKAANASSTYYCSHCYRQCMVSEGFSCPSCSHPSHTVFCSSKCLSLGLSKTHTPWVIFGATYCDSLRQFRHCSLLLDHQPEERQVQARYLVAAYNLAITSPSTFETLLSLHGEGREKDVEAAMFLHYIISSLSFPDGFSAPSVETIAALLDKESCNSFSLMEPYSVNGGRSARAYGLYTNASYFNHDCLPNACRFDYLDSIKDDKNSTDLVIRLIQDVPPGKEICISYFRVGLSYRERKQRLLDYFGFACFCDRCKVDEGNDKDGSGGADDDSTFIAKYMCEGENCGGTLAPLPPSSNGNPLNIMECNFCGTLSKDKPTVTTISL